MKIMEDKINLTKKQLHIFNKLHKKYPVSLEFLECNINRILKFVNYILSLHFKFNFQLINRNNHVYTKVNVPLKNKFRVRANKKNKKERRIKKIKNRRAIKLQWSERIVLYWKKQRSLEKLKEKESLNSSKNDDITCINNNLSELTNKNDLNQNESIQSNNNNTQNQLKIFNQKDNPTILCDAEDDDDDIGSVITNPDEHEKRDNLLNTPNADTNSISGSETHEGRINLTPEEVEQQIKEQLELLKFGKRSLSFLSENSTPEKQNQNEKTESNLKITLSKSCSRLSSTENLQKSLNSNQINFDNESKANDVTNNSMVKASELDKIPNKSDVKDKTQKFKKCVSIDSFEISEKDALEAGPSSRIPSQPYEEKNPLDIEIPKSKESSSIETNDLLKKVEDTVDKLPKRKSGIIESLMNKFVNKEDKEDDKGGNKKDNRKEQIENNKIEQKVITVKTVEQINSSSSETLQNKTTTPPKQKLFDEYSSSSSDDFHGFSPDEIIPPAIPGMLPTPAVLETSSISAFISKEDNINNSITKRIKNLPTHSIEGLVKVGSIPPKFEMPALPIEAAKPRTLAEKRMILSKQRSYRYFIIENENAIYHELKRRSRDGRSNNAHVQTIQKSKVPANRDLWKAICWLITDFGKFFFHTIEIDGNEYKIYSGKGNFEKKQMKPQWSSPAILWKKSLKRLNTYPNKNCPINCADKLSWLNLNVRYKPKPIKMVENIKNFNNTKMIKKEFIKPAPLSAKKNMIKSLDGEFDHLEIYKMPKIELEVFPKLNKPLDDYIKGYLKMILPSENITKEWAEFAVSTLVEKSNENELENDENVKNSFKFTIPYLNDQNHILVRRIITRSEQYDDKFDLTFRDVLNRTNQDNDKLMNECADILSDMINSVAIGLSENSFIKDDPDLDNLYLNKPLVKEHLENLNNSSSEVTNCEANKKLNETIDESEKKEKDEAEKKEKIETEKKEKIEAEKKLKTELDKKKRSRTTDRQTRLLKELKRLNATIINASDTKTEKPKQCEKDFCRLGCICSSIVNQESMKKKHCKKIKCMLEKCSCPVTQLEAENPILTSEDAFIIRQQATSKLARVEREFTSTVVLDGNETLIINENQTKRRRRNNARLTNYFKSLEDEVDLRTKNCRKKKNQNKVQNTNDDNHETMEDDKSKLNEDESPPVKEAKLPVDASSMSNIDEDVMNKLKHCQVNLFRLENFDEHLVWCMVHRLYKCFCNGKDTEGKPFIIKKQEEEIIDEIYTRKAKYSFEKNDENKEPPQKMLKIDNKNNNLDQTNSPSSTVSIPSPKHGSNYYKNSTQTLDHHQNRIISAYINNDFYGCHRIQPIPKIYRVRNKRKDIKNHWRHFEENDRTKLILSERIANSEKYVRKVIIKRPISSMNNIENDNINTQNQGKKIPALQNKNSLLKPEIRALNNSLINSGNILNSNISGINSNNEPFKISSVVSLNSQAQVQNKNSPLNISTEISSNLSSNDNSQNFEINSNFIKESNNDQFALMAEQVQKEVMRRLNMSVTKTMHAISRIQTEQSANIPNPQPDLMIACQWKHFLQYYVEDKLYVWQVKNDKTTYYVGTMRHAMPYVSNAIAVVNIKAIRKDNLPLFGKMLIAKLQNKDTESLSILLNGDKDYWRILGFTKSSGLETKVGIIRPTTESHPHLTPKINTLFNLLTQQYIDNMRKKSELQNKLQKGSAQLGPPRKQILPTNPLNQPPAKKPTLEIPKQSFISNNKGINQTNINSSIPSSPTTSIQQIINITEQIQNGSTNERPEILTTIGTTIPSLIQIPNPPQNQPNTTSFTAGVCQQQTVTTPVEAPQQFTIFGEPPRIAPVTVSKNAPSSGTLQIVQSNDILQTAKNIVNSRTIKSIGTLQNVTPISTTPTFVVNRNSTGKSGIISFQNPNAITSQNQNINIISSEKSAPTEPKMNIKIRKLTKNEAMNEHFQVPLTNTQLNHRWLVLDLENDFSHIVFGNTCEILTHNKIKIALQRSKAENKMVRFPKVDGESVDCYIMKFDNKRIYLGPFHETIDPIITLYNSYEGGPMLKREDYDQKYNITRTNFTTGFWLCRKNGKIMFDMDPLPQSASGTIHSNQSNTSVMMTPAQLIKRRQSVANPIIKLTHENIPLIQSQCNMQLSNMNNNNNNNNNTTQQQNIITSSSNPEIKNVQYKNLMKQLSGTPPFFNVNQVQYVTSVSEQQQISFNEDTLFLSNEDNAIISNSNEGNTSNDKFCYIESVTSLANMPSTSCQEIQEAIPQDNNQNNAVLFENPSFIIEERSNVNKTQYLPQPQKIIEKASFIIEDCSNVNKTYPQHVFEKPQEIEKSSQENMTVTENRPSSVINSNNKYQEAYQKALQNPPIRNAKIINQRRLSVQIGMNNKNKNSPQYSMPMKSTLKVVPDSIKSLNMKDVNQLSKNSPNADNDVFIGKYNQVMITKNVNTNSQDVSQNKNIEIEPPNISKKPDPTNNGILENLTAELEQGPDGKLILKLPQSVQDKIAAQNLKVSKYENGQFVLVPADKEDSVSNSSENNNSKESNASKPLNTTSIQSNTTLLHRTFPSNSTIGRITKPILPNNTNIKTLGKPIGITIKSKDQLNKSPQVLYKIAKSISNATNSPIRITNETNNQQSNVGITINKTTTLISQVKPKNFGIIYPDGQGPVVSSTTPTSSSNLSSVTISTSTSSTYLSKPTNGNKVIHINNSTLTGGGSTKIDDNTKKLSPHLNRVVYTCTKPIPSTCAKPIPSTSAKSIPSTSAKSIPSTSAKPISSPCASEESIRIRNNNTFVAKKVSPNKINEKIIPSEALIKSNNGVLAGYFVSNRSTYPKFGGFRKGNEYMIKTNSKSALRLSSINEVARHLNNFVKKQCATYNGDTKWFFISFNKNNQNDSLLEENKDKIRTSDPLDISKIPSYQKKIIEKQISSGFDSQMKERVIVIEDEEDEEIEQDVQDVQDEQFIQDLEDEIHEQNIQNESSEDDMSDEDIFETILIPCDSNKRSSFVAVK